jgi:hypothetical protein
MHMHGRLRRGSTYALFELYSEHSEHPGCHTTKDHPHHLLHSSLIANFKTEKKEGKSQFLHLLKHMSASSAASFSCSCTRLLPTLPSVATYRFKSDISDTNPKFAPPEAHERLQCRVLLIEVHQLAAPKTLQ